MDSTEIETLRDCCDAVDAESRKQGFESAYRFARFTNDGAILKNFHRKFTFGLAAVVFPIAAQHYVDK